MSKTGAVRYNVSYKIDKSHPYLTQDGEDREDNPNQYIANMLDGSIAGFKYFDMKDTSIISVKVAGSGVGELQVSTTIRGEKVAVIPISPMKEKEMYTAPIQIDDGVNALYFTYRGEGSINFYSFLLE